MRFLNLSLWYFFRFQGMSSKIYKNINKFILLPLESDRKKQSSRSMHVNFVFFMLFPTTLRHTFISLYIHSYKGPDTHSYFASMAEKRIKLHDFDLFYFIFFTFNIVVWVLFLSWSLLTSLVNFFHLPFLTVSTHIFSLFISHERRQKIKREFFIVNFLFYFVCINNSKIYIKSIDIRRFFAAFVFFTIANAKILKS